MLTAKDLMNREVITVQADQNVRELAELFLRKNFSGAPVVDGAGKLIGIVTRNDLIFTRKRVQLPRSIAILDAFFFLDSPDKMRHEMQKIAGSRVKVAIFGIYATQMYALIIQNGQILYKQEMPVSTPPPSPHSSARKCCAVDRKSVV